MKMRKVWLRMTDRQGLAHGIDVYCLLWLIPPTNHGVTLAVNSVASFAAHRDLFPFIRSIVLISSPVNLISSPSLNLHLFFSHSTLCFLF